VDAGKGKEAVVVILGGCTKSIKHCWLSGGEPVQRDRMVALGRVELPTFGLGNDSSYVSTTT
jgi:hypothetical protein